MARSIERLGTPVVLCATVGGEVGDVLVPLLKSQTGIELVAVPQSAPSSVSMYDRRSGGRTLIARSEPSSIDRHAVDKLHSLTLAHAIGRGCCVLAGNIDTGVIPPWYYGRLCADLAAAVSDLADRVPHDLVVTRGPDRPAVARMDGRWYTVSPPRLAAVDWRGAGDAMAGAMAVAYLRGLSSSDVLRFGAAAGAASVTRRGLASLDSELVAAHLSRVRVDAVDTAARAVTT